MQIYDVRWGGNKACAMIATGNYNTGETHQGSSKKIRTYIHFYNHSPFADKYHIYALSETTYILLYDADIPTFYHNCQLYSKYCEERSEIEGNTSPY